MGRLGIDCDRACNRLKEGVQMENFLTIKDTHRKSGPHDQEVRLHGNR